MSAVPSLPDPAPETLSAWWAEAAAYLEAQRLAIVDRSPAGAEHFADSPLAGEGRCVVLRLDAAPASGGEPQPLHVVVGRTAANHYPLWGLSAAEAFQLHVGTRFMLEVGVSQLAAEQAGEFDTGAALCGLVAQVAPGEPVSDASVAATFAVGDERHAVCRCRIGAAEVYVFARDCPPGFSRRVELPPHVAYRLHLGAVLLLEAAAEARAARRQPPAPP